MSQEETLSNGVENEKPAHSTSSHDGPAEDSEKQQQRQQDGSQQDTDHHDHLHKKEAEAGPAGGFDATPIPQRPPGYTVKFTIHRATNLPMSDYHTLSSDPYVLAQLNTDTPTRHKEDSNLRWRTPTIRESTDPEWNESWTIANVPASGFKLKLRVYDEDPADQDDRLGNVHISVPSLSEKWEGVKEKQYEIRASAGSNRAYLVRAIAVCFSQTKHMRGSLYISMEVLGKTAEDGQRGRLYTVGPCRWFKHFSPMLGRIAQTKDDSDDEDAHDQHQQSATNTRLGRTSSRRPAQRYNFQANELQLQGPVPPNLYHRYVEFKPWVKRMFTSSGLQGVVISKVLHHQHSRVYNFDRRTQWGHFPDHPHPPQPQEAMTRQFLDLIRYDKGGRIFTYVLTLDALWRFTETGKEFGIDMLSKHTMHSDVSIYIAFSGEFFIRRLAHPDRSTSSSSNNPTHPPQDLPGGPPRDAPPLDPKNYELIIDNDSGTYRPAAHCLPSLKTFLASNLPGLHIRTLDSQADADVMSKMKAEQRERKKQEGEGIIFTQGSRSSSISSSDEEDLDRRQAAFDDDRDGRGGGSSGGGAGNTYVKAAKDQKARGAARVDKAKMAYGPKSRPGRRGDEAGEEMKSKTEGAEADRP
ncbi:hypothetical protein B0A50_04824 [Salinomyces thailandicus]|uniref:C2 domain-containing protein n=1 Tax=Salinomyces thailandicus TaxID=706561 RepID=A0A4U0TYU8_9PEZI|nr:hypothetical protein B0A50_04824 [Salinomyces thailandica]